jgi:PAS domain S-box-containing protein
MADSWDVVTMDKNQWFEGRTVKMTPVDRQALSIKNKRYLQSVRSNSPDSDLRSEIVGAIFDSTADGIIVFDEQKRIVLANETAARISRWDLEDVSRDELRERFHYWSEDGKSILPIDEEPLEVAMREKRSHQLEAFVTGDSLPEQGIWVRANAAPILDEKGSVAGAVTIFHDITERVLLQRQRDCLVSLIAHDVKNHLAAESIFLNLFAGLYPDVLSGEMAEMVASLKSSNERFMMMTESLMELSRASFFAGSAPVQDVDLGPILDTAVAAHAVVALQKKVTARLTVPPELPLVHGLPAVIGQIFHNIVLNAIEASEPNSVVDIEAGKSASGGVQVRIIDRGPGMTPEELQSLFDPKRVATHVKRTSHSTGFGLYLSAMLIESQGGTISCSSEPKKGTTVTVEFKTPVAAS